MTPSASIAERFRTRRRRRARADGPRHRAGLCRRRRRGRPLRARRRRLRGAGAKGSRPRSLGRSRGAGSIRPREASRSRQGRGGRRSARPAGLRPRDRKRAGRSGAEDRVLASDREGRAQTRSSRATRRGSRSAGLRRRSPTRRAFSACISFRRPNACLWSRSSSGPRTSDAVVARALALVRGAGKRPVLVRDGPGFFATRVFAAYLDEAVAMAAEGSRSNRSRPRRSPTAARSGRSPCWTRPASR